MASHPHALQANPDASSAHPKSTPWALPEQLHRYPIRASGTRIGGCLLHPVPPVRQLNDHSVPPIKGESPDLSSQLRYTVRRRVWARDYSIIGARARHPFTYRPSQLTIFGSSRAHDTMPFAISSYQSSTVSNASFADAPPTVAPDISIAGLHRSKPLRVHMEKTRRGFCPQEESWP